MPTPSDAAVYGNISLLSPQSRHFLSLWGASWFSIKPALKIVPQSVRCEGCILVLMSELRTIVIIMIIMIIIVMIISASCPLEDYPIMMVIVWDSSMPMTLPWCLSWLCASVRLWRFCCYYCVWLCCGVCACRACPHSRRFCFEWYGVPHQLVASWVGGSFAFRRNEAQVHRLHALSLGECEHTFSTPWSHPVACTKCVGSWCYYSTLLTLTSSLLLLVQGHVKVWKTGVHSALFVIIPGIAFTFQLNP